MEVEQRILQRSGVLTPAERRIAETILAAPQLVGFGTVADVAAAAGVGTATVVRFAVKLDFDGFSALQQSVQTDLTGQLRPAVERIRESDPGVGDVDVVRHREVECANVQSTLDALDRTSLAAVVDRLADDRHRVLVLSGVASRGVAMQFGGDLAQLRPGCGVLDGTTIDVARTLALAGEEPTVIAFDLRRYERWVIDAVGLARQRDGWVVAITDSVLSPLAANARHTFVTAADATGPFDSQVGTLALANLLVAGVAIARREEATSRLDALESAWRDADALTDT